MNKYEKLFFKIKLPVCSTFFKIKILEGWIVSVLLNKIFLQWILADDEQQLMKLKQKFAHFSEFFHLLEAIRGQNNIFSLRWKCNVCESGKIIRSHSNAPTSNLKNHVSKCHPETFSSFYQLSTPSKNVFIQELWINVRNYFLNCKYVAHFFKIEIMIGWIALAVHSSEIWDVRSN